VIANGQSLGHCRKLRDREAKREEVGLTALFPFTVWTRDDSAGRSAHNDSYGGS
jgi:hypothetical protein